ncbi:MAG: hypothetical protein HYR84_00920 [Planctomycetes bacterium]|nr:hypothetical protein [Planctomycetota bacterium]
MGNVQDTGAANPGQAKTEVADWMFANPWLWLGAGGLFTLWSWFWTLTFGELASDYRVIVLALGLLCAGVGLWTRWSHRELLYLRPWRMPIAFLLGLLFALIGIGTTVLFVMSFFPAYAGALKSASLFLVWISTAPPCFVAARHCLNYRADDPSEREGEQEVGLAFVVVAAICLLGSFTLYADRNDPNDWDTIRMFLRVCTAVSLYGSALTLATQGVRRLMLSVLFTIHFIGINSAALSAPPAPWIVQQTWIRFFRPYLQFVYLNNAYHFYAPEPGPSSYLWFRVIYQSPHVGSDGTRAEEGLWHKVPQIDDQGRIQHPVALDYQRFLSMTEAVAHPETLPSEYVYNSTTEQMEVHPFYANRLNLQPPGVWTLGNWPKGLRVPLQPELTKFQQVFIPNDQSQRLLKSFARFLGRKYAEHPDPKKADWTFKSVKMYRVVHWIPPVQWFLNDIPPTAPESFLPFYVGNYKADGSLIVDGDPYLFWLLPAIREDQNDPDSQIRDYCRRHAGDPQWIRRRSDRAWVTFEERER